MKKGDLEKLATVIPINPDSTNIIFINRASLSLKEAHILANKLGNIHNADFGCIVMISGNPNESVKLVSAKDVERVKE